MLGGLMSPFTTPSPGAKATPRPIWRKSVSGPAPPSGPRPPRTVHGLLLRLQRLPSATLQAPGKAPDQQAQAHRRDPQQHARPERMVAELVRHDRGQAGRGQLEVKLPLLAPHPAVLPLAQQGEGALE